MQKLARVTGFTATLGLAAVTLGCRATHDREDVAAPTPVQPAVAEKSDHSAPAAGPSDLISAEPNAMAREDHERADEAAQAKPTAKPPRRPEPLLRPVTR